MKLTRAPITASASADPVASARDARDKAAADLAAAEKAHADLEAGKASLPLDDTAIGAHVAKTDAARLKVEVAKRLYVAADAALASAEVEVDAQRKRDMLDRARKAHAAAVEIVRTNYAMIAAAAAKMRSTIEQADALVAEANRARVVDNAPGMDQASQNQRRDPIAGVKSVRAALDDLASAVTTPHMESVGKGLDTLQQGIVNLSKVAREHEGATTAIAGATAVALGLGAFNKAVTGLAALNTLATGSGGVAGTLAASSGARWAMLGRMGIYGGALGAGALAGMGLQAVGSVAAGKFWTPKDLSAVNDLKEQLAEVDEKMKSISATSKMPEMRDTLLAPLQAKAADLRNRIAQGEASGAGNIFPWSDAQNQFPMMAGTIGRGFAVGGRIPVMGAGLPGGSSEIGHIPAGGFFPPPTSSGPGGAGDTARAINVTVEGVVRGEGSLTVNAGSQLISLEREVRVALSGIVRGGTNTGKSSPDAAPGAQTGHGGD